MNLDTLDIRARDGRQLRLRHIETFDVSFPKRTIELVVSPYESPALVPFQGRMVTEVFSRGAYAGIERRPDRVKVNREHDVARSCGKALTFHPSREVGLVAELFISRTELGNETLELAADGVLDASAGYLPIQPDGEVWEERNRVRIRKAWLGHIALVAEPAYEEAKVLAVRNVERLPNPSPDPDRPPTPNLDLVRSWRLQDQFDGSR